MIFFFCLDLLELLEELLQPAVNSTERLQQWGTYCHDRSHLVTPPRAESQNSFERQLPEKVKRRSKSGLDSVWVVQRDVRDEWKRTAKGGPFQKKNSKWLF